MNRFRAPLPRVSFVIATHNRRDVLLHGLQHVQACGLAAGDFEVLLVDNASTDGTAAAVRELFPNVIVFQRPTNEGPCAKNIAIDAARGEFVVFLDDDSFPRPRAVNRMIEKFRFDASLGAAVFTITLPDGSRECSAYPDVCIGCGTGFRRQALIDAGGLPRDFFMAAEEYDLSLRLLDAGWRIRGFEDLHVSHLKTPVSRFPARIARLDARNNLLLAMRYFPDPWRLAYATAWLRRYQLLAAANGASGPFFAGAIEGVARAIAVEHRPLRPAAFERFSKLRETARRMAELKRRLGLKRVLFLDLGKNFLAWRLAARECGLEAVGIADTRLGGRGWKFDGLELLTDREAARRSFDVAIVANLSPVHAERRLNEWRDFPSAPVVDLFRSPAPQNRSAAA